MVDTVDSKSTSSEYRFESDNRQFFGHSSMVEQRTFNPQVLGSSPSVRRDRSLTVEYLLVMQGGAGSTPVVPKVFITVLVAVAQR